MSRPKLSKANREHKAIIEGEGLEVVNWSITGSNHVKFEVRLPSGHKRNAVCGLTPSDHRESKNLRSMVRRWKATA